MFLEEDEFNLSMVRFIKSITRNFMYLNRSAQLNGLELEISPLAEIEEGELSLERYIEEILMPMDREAQGVLLTIIPIVLRINVHIVNIDTSAQARVNSLIFITLGFGNRKSKEIILDSREQC